MKTFSQDFFDIKNFIQKETSYIYSNSEDKRITCHICYNVNDPFIRIMGASMVSILKNNPDLNITFHIFTDGYSFQKSVNSIL